MQRIIAAIRRGIDRLKWQMTPDNNVMHANPENVKRRHHSHLFFNMRTTMTIHVYNSPDGEAMFSVNTINFNSGQAGGGCLPSYQVDVEELNFSDDQQGQAATWQLTTKQPHGELKEYDAATEFIPLFVLEGHVKAKNEGGEFEPVKGLAFWMKPVRK